MNRATIYIGHKDGGFVDIGEITLNGNFEFCDKTEFQIADDKPHFDFSRRPNSGKFVTDACNAQSKNLLDRVKNNDWLTSVDGLPPVGTECEISNCGEKWEKVKILFMGKTICIADWCYKHEQHFHLSSVKFRPLKSERERAIDEMVSVIKSVPEYNDFGVAETLYDAGFRKEGK